MNICGVDTITIPVILITVLKRHKVKKKYRTNGILKPINFALSLESKTAFVKTCWL